MTQIDTRELADQLVAARPALDVQQQRIAIALYRLLAEGQPVSRDQLAERTDAAPGAIQRFFDAQPGVYLDDQTRVVGFWGLALGGMPHRMTAQTLAVFGAYAAGSASLLLALSLSAALAKGALARGLRRMTPIVNRLAGALLMLAGVYLVLYWLPALGDGAPRSSGALARASSHISSNLSDFFAAHTTLFAIVLAALIAAGALLLAIPRLRQRIAAAPHLPELMTNKESN